MHHDKKQFNYQQKYDSVVFDSVYSGNNILPLQTDEANFKIDVNIKTARQMYPNL